jgi:hypothetical protein
MLIAGAHDGTILDRGGKQYKPSTARGYEQLLRAYVIPTLGNAKLSKQRRGGRRASLGSPLTAPSCSLERLQDLGGKPLLTTNRIFGTSKGATRTHRRT